MAVQSRHSTQNDTGFQWRSTIYKYIFECIIIARKGFPATAPASIASLISVRSAMRGNFIREKKCHYNATSLSEFICAVFFLRFAIGTLTGLVCCHHG